MPKEHDTPRVNRPTILPTNRTRRNTRPSRISRLISQGRNLARSVRNLASRPRNTLHRAFNHTRNLLSRARFMPFRLQHSVPNPNIELGRVPEHIPFGLQHSVPIPMLELEPVVCYVFDDEFARGGSKVAYNIRRTTVAETKKGDCYFREDQIIKPIPEPENMVGIRCQANTTTTTFVKNRKDIELQIELAKSGLMPRILTEVVPIGFKHVTLIPESGVGAYRMSKSTIENTNATTHYTYIVERCNTFFDVNIYETIPTVISLKTNISNYCILIKKLIKLGYIWIDCKIENICDDGNKLIDAEHRHLYLHTYANDDDKTLAFFGMCVLLLYYQLYINYATSTPSDIEMISNYVLIEILCPNFDDIENKKKHELIHKKNKSKLKLNHDTIQAKLIMLTQAVLKSKMFATIHHYIRAAHNTSRRKLRTNDYIDFIIDTMFPNYMRVKETNDFI